MNHIINKNCASKFLFLKSAMSLLISKKLLHFYRCFILCLLLAAHSAYAETLEVMFTDSDGNPIKDAVIEIISPQIAVPDDWDFTGEMDQVDREFIDNVVTVVAGSYIRFPNSDDIQHHVYSFSDNNNFELPLYSSNEAPPVLFDTPGISVVGCNIYDWMLGYIYVGESHLMGKSDTDGRATIPGLDGGNYTFKVWHERARRDDLTNTFDVSISSGITQVEIEIDLGRDRRIRRTPGGSGNRYN